MERYESLRGLRRTTVALIMGGKAPVDERDVRCICVRALERRILTYQPHIEGTRA